MAGDLIPPPSPAGRPDPDAGRSRPELLRDPPAPERDDLVLHARPDEQAATPAPAAPARSSRYRAHFGFLTGALVGLALAAVAVAGLLTTRETPADPAAGWSAWRPTSKDRLVRAAEIAQHVGRRYRLNDGSQLVDVQAGPLSLNEVPLTPVVRTADTGGDIVPIYGDGVLYVLNGLGPGGAISKEKPSTERFALVEREAIELALYTFRYVDDVDHVVVMLPPPKPAHGTAGQTAAAAPLSEAKPVRTLLFRPGDLEAQLEAPLAVTFPADPPRPATISAPEVEAITRFASDNLFDASVRPSQTGQGFLVLDRVQTPSAVEDTLRETIPVPKGQADPKTP